MVAMAAGVAPIVPGFLHKAFVTAYNSPWFAASWSPAPSTVYSADQREMQAKPQYNL